MLGTHVEGFGLSVLGPDLWLADGGQVGTAHGQQSPATAMEGGWQKQTEELARQRRFKAEAQPLV